MSLFSIISVSLLGLTLSTGGQTFIEEERTSPDSMLVDQPVILRFGGDCLPGGAYEDAVGDSAGYAFEGFDAFRTADIAMVNLESPITMRGDQASKPFTFRVKPAFASALAEGGIKIVNIANNHIFDYGAQGLFDTILYLDSLKILHIGAGLDLEEAHRAIVFRVRGIRIGFLGYYGGGESPGATQVTPGVASRNLKEIREDIDSLRIRDSVQFVVVNFHWGTELAEQPDRAQEAFAHSVIDAGANAIIGHHPHVLQGVERYHEGVIVYSLGNFLFGGNRRDTYNTGLFEILLGGSHADYRLIPLHVEHWRLRLASDAAARAVVDHVRELSQGFVQTIFNK